jgi:NAD(P)-dependent dehydrogenase (short-subunit alcohol dehydrogenase family)
MAAPQKTVFVTGGTRGIGLALVEVYKQKGWKVITSAHNLDTADKLKALSPNEIVQLDTSDEASILLAAKELEGEPIDLLINNAGIANFDTIATTNQGLDDGSLRSQRCRAVPGDESIATQLACSSRHAWLGRGWQRVL